LKKRQLAKGPVFKGLAGKGHFEKDLQKMNTKTVKKRQTKGHSV
jgi:hypothetical protein